MRDLQIFNYQDKPVRTLLVDGEPWFVLADLAKVLGIAAPGRLASRLDEGVRQAHTLQTAGGPQNLTIVSEAGMYEVVIRSDKPEAVAFRRWITHEVLPSIRKTGGYGQVELTREQLLARAVLESQEVIAEKDATIAELSPKADAYEAFMNADGTYSVGRVAKMLGRSQNKLFAELRNAGVFIAKGHMHNTPYQKYMHHFKVTPYSYERKDDTIGCSYTTTVQPSGVEFIRRKLGIPHVQHELEVA
ncbi:phage antirepressor [Brevibacterium casei]|uniref:phage antirepressor n=1 Tax=Brevibacterium casei TaxID=33889 RepID=UPI00223A8F6C|nr:phage antirepressor [Brevibacterium casei]MCT2357038.1 phage antirepressor [Brevibacterium casei]